LTRSTLCVKELSMTTVEELRLAQKIAEEQG